MAAATASKMIAAVCVAMLLVHSSLGYQPALPALGGVAGLACPSSESECRAKCRLGCDPVSVAMCQTICTVPITPLGSTCVNNALIACGSVCLATCQTLWRH